MIIRSSHEKINELIEFLYHNSCVDLYFGSFDYSKDILLDLLANCDKIENVDYSKFIVYVMLSKFYPNPSLNLSPSSLVITIQNVVLANLFMNVVLINSCPRDFAASKMTYIALLI